MQQDRENNIEGQIRKAVDLIISGQYEVSSQSILVPGSLTVVMDNQPHKGAIVYGRREKVRKLICKISV